MSSEPATSLSAVAAVASVATLVLVGTDRLRRWRERRGAGRSVAESPEPSGEAPSGTWPDGDGWVQGTFRVESEWNTDEERAYLYLHRRSAETRSFHVTVFDPTNVLSETGDAEMNGVRLLAIYPNHFHAPPEVLPGTYHVIWKALVHRTDGPVLQEVARDSFDVP